MLYKCDAMKTNGDVKTFYFEHKDEDYRQRAVELLNEHNVNYTDLIVEVVE